MSPIDLQRVKVSTLETKGDQGAAAAAHPHHQPRLLHTVTLLTPCHAQQQINTTIIIPLLISYT